MLHWPPPTSWAPTGPAAAGCSLQKSAGLFARSLTTPTRGCENANSAFKSEPTNIRSTIKQSLINADYRL